MTQPDVSLHLNDHTVARFVDDELGAAERADAEAHLAGCAECRQELAEVRAILRTRTRPGWVPLVPLAGAAAAAVALFVLLPGTGNPPATEPLTREPALTTTLAPQPIAPLGTVADVDAIQWSAVPGAARYRLTVFAADGLPIWQSIPADTISFLPDSLGLVPGETYYWQIKAETGPGRWVESQLVPFTLAPQAGSR